MGLQKRMAQDAKRVKAAKPKKAKPKMTFSIRPTKSAGMVKFFEEIPELMRVKVLHGGTVMVARRLASELEARAPSSKQTGSRENWSRKVRNQRAHNIDIRMAASHKKLKAERHRDTVAALSGFTRPYGNHAYLIEFGADVKLWGSEKTVHIPPRPFMRPAFDNIKAEEEMIMRRYVKAEAKKL